MITFNKRLSKGLLFFCLINLINKPYFKNPNRTTANHSEKRSKVSNRPYRQALGTACVKDLKI